MICLDTFSKSLKITWVRRFYDNACNSGWKHFVIDTLPDVLHITNFGYAFMFKLIKTCKNAFWINVFSAFLELRKCIETNSNVPSRLPYLLYFGTLLFPVKMSTAWFAVRNR